MYLVSDAYKSAIYGIERTIKSRVTFNIAPIDVASDTVYFSTSPAFEASSLTQLSDNVKENTYQLSTWETDRTKLDGSFTFMSANALERGHVGWVSDNLSDADGLFIDTSIYVEYTNVHTSAGFTIVFDTEQDEYAEEFTVTILDDLSNIIYQQNVTNNTSAVYNLVQPLTNFRKILVEFEKWSKPFRRARVAELIAGLYLQYDNNQIINLKLTEEADMTGATVVVPQFEFTVDNSAMTFNMFDSTGLTSYLQDRQEIVPELGLVMSNRTEWVPLGVFLLSEWRTDFGSLTATFKGRSKLDLLDDINYEFLAPSVPTTVGALLQSLLNQAAIGAYEIDSSLNAVNIYGYATKVKGRVAFSMALMAGRAAAYVGRDNVLYIKRDLSLTEVESITKEEQWEEPQIELLKPTKKVTVSYYGLTGNKAGEAVATDATVPSGQTLNVDKNTFITDSAHAQDVADWLLARSSYRKKLTMDFRGNPALELFDLANVESRFYNQLNTFITKQELNYEGYLTARSEGVSN